MSAEVMHEASGAGYMEMWAGMLTHCSLDTALSVAKYISLSSAPVCFS